MSRVVDRGLPVGQVKPVPVEVVGIEVGVAAVEVVLPLAGEVLLRELQTAP
jgi:hypothetical protein